MKNEVVKFVNGSLELEVEVSENRENVWLSLEQMARLFDRDRTVITKHINNIFKDEELNRDEVCAKFAHTTKHGSMANKTQTRQLDYYNLDVIISVGYRVKSQNGIIFRKWATSILKDYLIKGYSINQKRLDALNKTVLIQTRMLASALNIEENDVLRAINLYTEGLSLLDDYDHQEVSKPKGNKAAYQMTYKECRKLIDNMNKEFGSGVFGVEKEKGKLEGIIASVYQTAFGEELYPTVEEKAANLLYFLIKDHPFADGCKRIGASIFLDFLDKSGRLIVDNKQVISNSALVAITLLVAESRADEKDIIVKLIMNFLVNAD